MSELIQVFVEVSQIHARNAAAKLDYFHTKNEGSILMTFAKFQNNNVKFQITLPI